MWLAVLIAIIPDGTIARDSVDLLEVNSFYDGQGNLVFVQQIFLDWSKDDARYMVRSWRLLKHPSQLPQRDRQSGGYVTTWMDGELLRVVRCTEVRETFTQYDPELNERDILPKERRRELTSQRVPVPPELLRNAKAKWQGVGQ